MLFYISSKLRTFMGLFIRNRQMANAMFLVLLILLVIPTVSFVELRHLRYFAAVAAHGSFSRAANQLHLTQPALSRQVKSLEEEIGIALIVRGQNAMSLTSAGEAFYEEAKDILARVDLAVRRIKTRPPGEKLRIGYVHSLTAGIMPRVVERFQSYNKDVFLELSDLTTDTMWQRAAAEQIDIAILPKSLEARFTGFQWVELQRLAPVLVVSKKNPLAKLTRIHPEKLRDKMLLGLGTDKYPEYVPRLQAILKPFGVNPQLRNHTSEDIAALFIAIEAQAGMAVLTEGVFPMLPSTLTALRFSPELAPLLIAAGTPTLRPNPHSEAFLKILLEEINKSCRRNR
jgi:DNA-binding transcriptional LysR family regulator